MERSFADIFHNEVTAWVVLAVSLCVTAIGWYVSSEYVERRAEDRFHFEVEDARQRIRQRMLDYEQVLRGGVALFSANRGEVERDAWRSYVSTLHIERFFPGIQGIGYSRMLTPDEVSAHEAQLRAAGFEGYRVHPAGERERYSAIVYLEPFDWRNRRAFGYDMYSDPVRHAAMRQAMDSARPAVSGRVTLVQETDQDVQAGFLMYLPVYRPGRVIQDLEQRRDAILGFVYSPFRMKDLMYGILGQDPAGLDFQLYDDGRVAADSLLYDSLGAGAMQRSVGVARYTADVPIDLPGRRWLARFSSMASFERQLASAQPGIIAVGGIAVDLLLFTIIWSLSQQKRRISNKNALLEVSQDALAEREARYRAVLDTSPDGFWVSDNRGLITEVNEAYCRLSGYSREQLLKMSIPDLEASESPEETARHIDRIIHQGHDRFETLHRARNGRIWPVEVTTSFWPLNGGLFFVFARDISELKALEAERAANEERVRNMAFYDALTDLPNRRMLLDRLQQAVAGSDRDRQHRALLFIDLDHFKEVNDTLGHEMGDQLLIEVARRLRGCVREMDTVGRLGGDEFVVMLEQLAEQAQDAEGQARGVGDKILQELNRPYRLGEHIHLNSPSVGITLFCCRRHTPDELLRRADAAMYDAKSAGRNTLRFYDTG